MLRKAKNWFGGLVLVGIVVFGIWSFRGNASIASGTQDSLHQNQWNIISWGADTPEWSRKLNLSGLRLGFDGEPESGVQEAKEEAKREDVSKVFLSIVGSEYKVEETPMSTIEDYVLQYSKLSLNHSSLYSIGFDDFAIMLYKLYNNASVNPASILTFLRNVIRNTKSANPKLKFGVTLYEDEIEDPEPNYLTDPWLPRDIKAKIDYVHLYLNYRTNWSNYEDYVKQAKKMFPNAKIIAGSYAYDRIDYLPRAQEDATDDWREMDPSKKCTVEEEINLYKKSIELQARLLKNGIIDGIEFFPGYFGTEERIYDDMKRWYPEESERFCKSGRTQEAIKNTKIMHQIAFEVLSSVLVGRTQKSPMQSTPVPKFVPTLRSLAKVHGIQIGASVEAEPLKDEVLYAQTLRREFSILTPDYAMQCEEIHPAPNRYNFSGADAIVAFAEANAMQVRGHVLVAYDQPTWLIETEANLTRNKLIEILRQHILTVAGRYRGRIAAWDVVNEAVDWDGSYRDSIWLRVIGPDYIELAFRWAHEADPEALLFYNDFDGEGLGQKSDAIYNLVQGLQRRGVPIHGVGLQMHIDLKEPPEPEDVTANMNRLAKLGLEVHITEMDVPVELPVTEEKLVAQARIYQDMLGVCLSAQNCKAFVMWGFTDRYSWITDPEYQEELFPGQGAALIFDESYHPKPAYDALIDTLIKKDK